MLYILLKKYNGLFVIVIVKATQLLESFPHENQLRQKLIIMIGANENG